MNVQAGQAIPFLSSLFRVGGVRSTFGGVDTGSN